MLNWPETCRKVSNDAVGERKDWLNCTEGASLREAHRSASGERHRNLFQGLSQISELRP
jgi:hypothetical protein